MGGKPVKVDFNAFQEVSREEWGALPRVARDYLDIPVGVVVLHFTNTPTCNTREECVRTVKEIQREHIYEKRLIDIKYNFLVGGDGGIYVGRGWDSAGVRIPLEDNKLYENNNIEQVDIAYIGSYDEAMKSTVMCRAIKNFIRAQQFHGKITMKVFFFWMEGGLDEMKDEYKKYQAARRARRETLIKVLRWIGFKE